MREDVIMIDDREMHIELDESLINREKVVPDWYENYLSLARKLLNSSLSENAQSNVVVSPFSLYMMLVLTLNATSGKSRKEIKDVLAKKYTVENLTGQVGRMQRDLCKQMKGGKLSSSNGIYLDESIYDNVLEEYKNSVCKVLDAEIFSGGDNAIQRLNKWVCQKTDGMISELFNNLSMEFKACLMNAIAFRAKWQVPYEEDDIEDEWDFTNADGTVSLVTMLSSTEKGFIGDEFFMGFVKPYKGERYDLMCLLPNKKKSRTFLKRALDNIDFKKYYDSRDTEHEVSVRMPEFECFTDTELKEFCQELGIKEIFTERGNFGGMLKGDAEPLMVDSVMQKAYIKVSREGTKAAAVTSMMFCPGCAPDFENVESVTLDRPFVYAIMSKETGLPVFVGMVNQL